MSITSKKLARPDIRTQGTPQVAVPEQQTRVTQEGVPTQTPQVAARFDRGAKGPKGAALTPVAAGIEAAVAQGSFAPGASVRDALIQSKSQQSGPFAELRLKDTKLNRLLHGFTGITALGAEQVQTLLNSARDGKGLSKTETKDLNLLFRSNHVDGAGKALLAQALGLPSFPPAWTKLPWEPLGFPC